MGLSAKEQFRWWGIGFVVFVLTVWLLGGALTPFVLGAAIAYFLDPLADRLERLGFPRLLATIVIMALALIVVVILTVSVFPMIFGQLQALISAMPQYFTQLGAFLNERFPWVIEEGSPVRSALASVGEAIQSNGLSLLNSILTGSLAVLDSLLILFVSPVVAFYLLLDWDKMIAEVDKWLPREHASTIRRLTGEIDTVLAGFVRGQLTVSLILGTFYATALGLIGLQFGIVIGMIAGILTFIPYVGSITGGVLSIGIALFQFWNEPLWILVVAAVFLGGQAVEGNILTPKLVGGSVGLHPVWLMFALAAFGAMFGFAGLLIAVPVAASIGVLGRFGLQQYLDSKLYKGPEPPAE